LLTNLILPRLFACVVSRYLPEDSPIGVLRARQRLSAIGRAKRSCAPDGSRLGGCPAGDDDGDAGDRRDAGGRPETRRAAPAEEREETDR
jgi:hypothetical protein